MVEFEIDGRQFRFDKMPAMQQFHVSRKIAPLMPPLFPIFAQVAKEMEGKGLSTDLNKLGPLLAPFTEALAQMSDESAEYVFNACLGAIRYKHGDNWIPLWNTSGRVVMVAELNDPSLLLRLTARVIQDSLAPFIASFASGLKEAKETSPDLLS